MTNKPRLVERTFPLKQASPNSAREKTAREVGGVWIAHVQIMEVGEV